MSDLAARAATAGREIEAAVAAVDPTACEALVAEIAGARRIVLSGAGREGLMMRALAMRFYHLGCDAHVAGDMSCPPLGPGDLLFVSAGPGDLPTIEALVAVARRAGARVACLTGAPKGPVPRRSDLVVTIPAQTMANDRGDAATSILPMGSVFEGAMFLLFELLVLDLRDRMGVTPEAMRDRHTNLE